DQLLNYAIKKGFKDAFVVEFVNNEKLIGNQNYRIQFLASDKKYRDRDGKFGGLKDVLRIKKGKTNFYYYGTTKTYEDAQKELNYVKSRGFRNAIVVVFDGKKPLE